MPGGLPAPVQKATLLRLDFCPSGPAGDLESTSRMANGIEVWRQEDWTAPPHPPPPRPTPVSLLWPSARTSPRRHTAALGDPGWAGRRCKCWALRTSSASIWKTHGKTQGGGFRTGRRVVKATSLKEFITRLAPVSCNTRSFRAAAPSLLGLPIELWVPNFSSRKASLPPAPLSILLPSSDPVLGSPITTKPLPISLSATRDFPHFVRKKGVRVLAAPQPPGPGARVLI